VRSVAGVKIGFWRHQAIEYLIAVLVLAVSIQANSGTVVTYVIIGVFVFLAATSDGPLSAFKVFSRATHRALDIAAAVALVAVAVLLGDGSGDLTLGVGAAALLAFLAWRTDYSAPKPRRGFVIETPGPSRSEDIGRAAGKVAARGVQGARAAWRSRRPGGGDTP
jgi:hypothetical protein